MASEQRYLDAAERAVKVFAEGLAEAPGAQSSLAIALERLQSPPSLLVLMGEASNVRDVQRRLERRYRPDLVVLALPGDDVPEALRKGEPPSAGWAAWLCHGTQCLPPVSDVEAVEALLRANA
jgi:uncharacterized protein YyaL (SSP411 family)